MMAIIIVGLVFVLVGCSSNQEADVLNLRWGMKKEDIESVDGYVYSVISGEMMTLKNPQEGNRLRGASLFFDDHGLNRAVFYTRFFVPEYVSATEPSSFGRYGSEILEELSAIKRSIMEKHGSDFSYELIEKYEKIGEESNLPLDLAQQEAQNMEKLYPGWSIVVGVHSHRYEWSTERSNIVLMNSSALGPQLILTHYDRISSD